MSKLPFLHPQPLPTTSTGTGAASIIREYRKGNWAMGETLILISAKKLDDERRLKSSTTQQDSAVTTKQPQCKSGGGELRWKWVENYCFNHGCNRSQNQCNDKWDNLLRDYKKIREYESQVLTWENLQSYWKLEKHERKDRNLPANMGVEVFEALNDVIQRRETQRNVHISPSPVVSAGVTFPAVSDSLETSSSTRLKVRKIGSTIIRSASKLVRTIKNYDEKKEKRHQRAMEIEQQRIRIEEIQNEVNQQGFTNLVAAVTNLSGAIQSLVSSHHNRT